MCLDLPRGGWGSLVAPSANRCADDILKFAVDLVFAAHFQMPQRLAAAFGPSGKLRREFGAAGKLQVAMGAVADDGDYPVAAMRCGKG
ncbi:hypothetical protein [Hyphomonas sp.]|uniref:hypothetical protein n=1 Tax=Hyphomonas sp. TaxID=87 RepID=UPI003341CF33